MGRLFKIELLKMRYSRMLWVILGGSVALVILTGCFPEGTLGWGDYGVMAPFGYLRACGTMVMMLFAPVAGCFFTRELKQGTMLNALSCGVDRRQYFWVKAVCIIGVCLLDYLVCIAIFFCLRVVVSGFYPSGGYPDCSPGVFVVYQLGCFIFLFTYITLFLFISVSMKKPAAVNLSSIVIWFIEGVFINSVRGLRHPMAVLLSMYDMWEEGKVLTPEFVRQFDHCVILGIVFLLRTGGKRISAPY